MNERKVENAVGLAMRAGKIASGDLAVTKAARSGKALLLLVAADCADGTKKKYSDLAAHYRVPLRRVLTKEALGRAVGKPYRAAVAVTDGGLAKMIEKAMDD